MLEEDLARVGMRGGGVCLFYSLFLIYGVFV